MTKFSAVVTVKLLALTTVALCWPRATILPFEVYWYSKIRLKISNGSFHVRKQCQATSSHRIEHEI